MSVQGHLLEITVIGCNKLKDTEWISRQDPYVVLEYAGTRYRTKTDTDGGRNPTFNEKYMLPLIEGLREVNVSVWNSNTVSADDFIGSGKIHLQKVLTSGYDDGLWPLTSRSGKRSGEVRVIMHYTSQKEKHNSSVPSAPSAYPPPQPSGHVCYPPAYATYPQAGNPPYDPYAPATPYVGNAVGYPPAPAYGAPPPYGAYPPQTNPYPPPGGYPPPSYPYPSPQGYPPYGAPPPGPYRPY